MKGAIALPPGRAVVVAAALLVGAIAGGCSLARLWEPSRDEVLQRILPSSVQVVLEQQEGRRVRSGSGVTIAARPSGRGYECFVLTAGHFVTGMDGKRQAYVLVDRHRSAGRRIPANVVAQRNTADLDLAVLRMETEEQCAIARPGRQPVLGEPIWVVAFPWGRQMTLTSGIISQVRLSLDGGEGESSSRLMVDALVGYGSSGGGVFEGRTGRLIGVVEGYNTARVTATAAASDTPWYIDVPMPGQTFVTPLTDIQRFLGEIGRPDLFPE
jgi:S1-C subfamily serine protease